MLAARRSPDREVAASATSTSASCSATSCRPPSPARARPRTPPPRGPANLGFGRIRGGGSLAAAARRPRRAALARAGSGASGSSARHAALGRARGRRPGVRQPVGSWRSVRSHGNITGRRLALQSPRLLRRKFRLARANLSDPARSSLRRALPPRFSRFRCCWRSLRAAFFDCAASAASCDRSPRTCPLEQLEARALRRSLDRRVLRREAGRCGQQQCGVRAVLLVAARPRLRHKIASSRELRRLASAAVRAVARSPRAPEKTLVVRRRRGVALLVVARTLELLVGRHGYVCERRATRASRCSRGGASASWRSAGAGEVPS